MEVLITVVNLVEYSYGANLTSIQIWNLFKAEWGVSNSSGARWG